MNEFRLAQPGWGHLFWPILSFFAVYVAWEFRKGVALGSFLSPAMQPRLIASPSLGRRRSATAVLIAGSLLAVGATVRPQWGWSERTLPQFGAQVMVCLDVSKSMLAEDVVPNRLERAKAELGDLLELLRGDQVGLIAFAGKATVVSPLTTDFAFLKLVLDDVDPTSVGLGGTRLEEPLRMATSGFAEGDDVSRVILLITDGEDHDSFPREAAEDAFEKGIRIITIGFGDESGSRIQVTNATTGGWEYIKDADGQPVISRLDGELLRDIALRTEGAYVPAGTGALDLPSIHRRFIEPLVRGQMAESTQVVRAELFAWPLGGAVLLVAAALWWRQGIRSGSRSWFRSPNTTTAATWGAACLGCLLLEGPLPSTALGQPAVPQDVDAQGASAPPGQAEVEAPKDPRELYNRATAALAEDAANARELLHQARQLAAGDGEVRFRAAYNLGWADVRTADACLADTPEKALEHLRSAADWFRDAVRLRPKNEDARINLELVMRRVLELADALAEKDEGTVPERLDALIQEQRRHIADVVALIESSMPEAAHKRQTRSLATHQRQLLGDLDGLTRLVAEELEASRVNASPTGDDQRTALSLEATAEILPLASQRFLRARSHLRRQQPSSALRRALAGLEELKHARDQWQSPQQALNALLSDQRAAMAQRTQRETRPSPPDWMTPQLLAETQAILAARTRDVSEGFAQMMAESEQGPSPATDESAPSPEAPDWATAHAWVDEAAQAMQAATQHLGDGQWDTAAAAQEDAAERLESAIELFMDERPLIDAALAAQRTLHRPLRSPTALEDSLRQNASAWSAAAELSDAAAAHRDSPIAEEGRQPEGNPSEDNEPQAADTQAADTQAADTESMRPGETDGEETVRAASTFGLPSADVWETLPAAQQENQQRMARLATLLEPPIPTPQNSPKTSEADERASSEDTAESAEEARREAAQQRVRSIRDKMSQLQRSFETNAEDPSQLTMDGFHTLRDLSRETVEELEELQRLYFSVTEQLREVARRQENAIDASQGLAAETNVDESSRARELGRQQLHQTGLATHAEAISAALRDQASAAGNVPGTKMGPIPDPAGTSDAANPSEEQAGEPYLEAAEYVDQAATAMRSAAEGLAPDRDAFAGEDVRDHQQRALEQIRKALATLEPPSQDNQDANQNQEGQGQGPDSHPSPAESDSEEDDAKEDTQQALAQLLQRVRDREAARRKERHRSRSPLPSSVEKDW